MLITAIEIGNIINYKLKKLNMSKRNSLIEKAARRERKLANKLSQENLNPKFNFTKESTEKNSNNKVGIVIELVMKSGESKPVFFETDRDEFFEVIENLKCEKDIESQKEGWFQILVLALMEINPVDHTFFNAAVLSIASTSAFMDLHNQYPNKPIGFSIMIHEHQYGYQIHKMSYELWQEIFNHHNSSLNLKLKKLSAKY